MKTNQRREGALKALAATGMLRSNYEPPLLRLLWRLGFNIPPPHFAPFWANAIASGVLFGVAWGALMWFVSWSRQGTSLAWALIAAAAAGVLFGAAMAGFYAHGKRKYSLPSWHDLQ
jgi:hypothetical protein